MSLHVVILAAGLGKRMYSTTPKVLHCLAGKPLLTWVVECAQKLEPARIHIIYGNGGQFVRERMQHLDVNWIPQDKQLGTGHAVKQALPHIPHNAEVLVLSADVPLIQPATLYGLQEAAMSCELALLLANMDDPSGLGRIVRNHLGEINAIVEEKDADATTKLIKEIYSGICCAKASALQRWLPMLNNNNAQNEFYLTDIIALAVNEGQQVSSVTAKDNLEIQGVNTLLQLQELEKIWQQRQAEQLLLAGTRIIDSRRFDLRGELSCGRDVIIDINCIFNGNVTVGNGSIIGANCIITDSVIGENCEIKPYSLIENCQIGNECQIGPFARLRPGTALASQCKIGNFVETKNAVMDVGAKASHLSYLGDVLIGKEVNIGAGVITCNYDGINKHQTIIEDGVFVGSDTQLVAPVRVGANATIGAGSTIRKDVPADELTLSDNRQKTVYGWKRPQKKSKIPL